MCGYAFASTEKATFWSLIQLQMINAGYKIQTFYNQLGVILFSSVGDHDFLAFLSLVAFSASVTLLTLSHFLSASNIFSRSFPSYVFLQSFQLSQDVILSLFSSHSQKRCLGAYIFYLQVILCQLLINLFRLISLQSMSLLPPVSFVSVFEIVQFLHPFIRMGSI